MSLCIANTMYQSHKPNIKKDLDFIQKQLISILQKLRIRYTVFPEKYILSQLKNKEYRLLWIRDVFFNINKELHLCNISHDYRVNDHHMVSSYFNSQGINYETKSLSCTLEGGDIIEYKDLIFVGLPKRTSGSGVSYLKKIAKQMNPQKTIIPIKHDALHLDCVFNILPNDNVIIYSESYIKNIDRSLLLKQKNIHEIYTLEELSGFNKKISFLYALNYLHVYPNHIIVSHNDKFTFFYKYLTMKGYIVHFIKTNNIERFGGSIRCLTQWINKPKYQTLF